MRVLIYIMMVRAINMGRALQVPGWPVSRTGGPPVSLANGLPTQPTNYIRGVLRIDRGRAKRP